MKRYYGYLLANIIFGIESLCLNYAELKAPVVLTQDDYVNKIQLFAWGVSMISVLMYAVTFLFTLNFFKKIQFDFFDRSFILLCFLFSVIDSRDYLASSGWRPTWLDWWVFISMDAFLLAFKFVFSLQPRKT